MIRRIATFILPLLWNGASCRSQFPRPEKVLRWRNAYDEKSTRNSGGDRRWLEELGNLRREILASHPAGSERKALLHTLAELPVWSLDECPSREMAFPERVQKEICEDDCEEGNCVFGWGRTG